MTSTVRPPYATPMVHTSGLPLAPSRSAFRVDPALLDSVFFKSLLKMFAGFAGAHGGRTSPTACGTLATLSVLLAAAIARRSPLLTLCWSATSAAREITSARPETLWRPSPRCASSVAVCPDDRPLFLETNADASTDSLLAVRAWTAARLVKTSNDIIIIQTPSAGTGGKGKDGNQFAL
eukprot:CAMPEP_0172685904 /NCGR_PEP_ID=MMETSP1074-20121228/20569_1 /TAXON_ID=2916 /ORGANISM="Ceratium fusus, Strain PA161109" /LENGTH=178 /DNA_ID=CAMNT_0013505135 /DNA_START=207 /DNA_END=743 /DNA_ORIENTATION=+